MFFQIVVDLAAAQEKSFDVFRRLPVRQDFSKLPARAVCQRGNDLGMAQQALRRHDDQRLSPLPLYLPAKTMKVLGGCGWIDDLDIVLRGQSQETFEPRAGVFGTLSFKSVRQQQHNPAQSPPLVFRAGDELVDDDLRRIPEVAELRFPTHQSVWPIQAVAVFESQHSCLGKRAVQDFDRRLIRGKVLQRRVGLASSVVMQHRVPLAESPASRDLSRQADAMSLGGQTSKSQ